MIKELLNEIRIINNENYNSIACQKIEVMEYDLEEGILYLNFNDKLKLKITYNADKNFIKFEILEQDIRFWSQNSNQTFRYTSENNIPIISNSYLDVHLVKEGYFELLGYQSLIEDGVTVYLDRDSIYDYKKETLKEFFIALMDWSYNAPEFNIKEEVKEIQLTRMSKEQELFKLFEQSESINNTIEITGFNLIEDFDKENSLITIKIKKGV